MKKTKQGKARKDLWFLVIAGLLLFTVGMLFGAFTAFAETTKDSKNSYMLGAFVACYAANENHYGAKLAELPDAEQFEFADDMYSCWNASFH